LPKGFVKPQKFTIIPNISGCPFNPSQALSFSMEDQIFNYSVKVCADEVKKSGSFTTLPVRIKARNDIAVEASLRLLKDWEHHVNDGLSKVILTSNSPVGNLWALACAECPPEKLGIATYFSDIGFFYDG
jgi:hypothetical protein